MAQVTCEEKHKASLCEKISQIMCLVTAEVVCQHITCCNWPLVICRIMEVLKEHLCLLNLSVFFCATEKKVIVIIQLAPLVFYWHNVYMHDAMNVDLDS